MDISEINLPRAVKVNGRFYKIHADFKHILKLKALLKDKAAKLGDFDFLYRGEIPADRMAGLIALCEFMNPPRELPRVTGDDQNGGEIVIDYEIDGELIYSAFMDNYGIDIIDQNIHWYKFQALLHGVHDCKLADVIGFRLFDNDGKNDAYTKRMQKLKDAWRLPQPEDNEPDKALDDFLQELNRG